MARRLGLSSQTFASNMSLIFLIWCFCAATAVVEEDETNYVNLVLGDLDNYNSDHAAKLKEDRNKDSYQVKRFLGIPDRSAFIGKMFEYPIPPDAFIGSIQKVEVTEAGESGLPSWLQFDIENLAFIGVPLSQDLGQYYISVKVTGNPSVTTSVAKDVFSIEVIEDTTESSHVEPNHVISKCKKGQSKTLASIIIDANLNELNVTDRIHQLRSLSTFLKLPLKTLKISNKMDGQSFDGNAILAGPGNAKKQLKRGSLIQWEVGCSMMVSSEYKDAIATLEKTAENGDLSKALQQQIIGWQVISVFPKLPHRNKRHTMGTPVPAVMPTHYPRFTDDVDEVENIDETMIPEARVVPTMASPMFTHTSHHHRHHHGEPDFGRAIHNHAMEPMEFTISPTIVHHRIHAAPTAHLGGTPIVYPERPTMLVSPTIVDELMPSRFYSRDHTPVDGLMSSMVTPTSEFEMMKSVPVTSETYVPVVPEIEIKPTKTHVAVEMTKKPLGTPNSKPTIERRMKKLLMVAGKVWRYAIPKDTFADTEDGDTSQLKLFFMTSERSTIPASSWIQFDPEKQMLYALPLEEHIGKYEYILEAMDSEGASTNDRLDIHVWQHTSARSRHHEFSVKLKYNKWEYPINIDWNIEFARKLARYFGDHNETNVAVQTTQNEPGMISWSNDSLPTHPCPHEEIAQLTRMLIGADNDPTRFFRKAMNPEFTITSAKINLHGVCHHPVSTTPSTKLNSAPKLRNPIERINTTVGEILRFKIPDDMFYDREDGGTRQLTLTFLTIESIRPLKSSWVEFDPKSQELYGLPFESDAGRHEFQIVAIDSGGLQKNDVFIIEVHPRPPKKWNVEFSIHINHSFEEFSQDISKKVLVAWKLAKLYNDPDPQYISVGSISQGSVVYAWTNNTLPHDPCPKKTIKRLVKNIFNDNGTLSAKLVNAMLPEFHIIKADAMPLGICLGEVTPTSVTVTPSPFPPPAAPAATSDDDIYITTVIPAVVIAFMLIVAAIVACFLYRKKHKGKMTMHGDNTFIGNRAPVIFGDEMEDRPDPAKPPVIMKEEKPPLAPPDYLRSSASSRESTPQLDRLETSNPRNANIDLHSTDPSPPYQPPPPFTTNRDSKSSRPKATPTYRQPPPYMPPVPP